jgi:2-oxoglutarate dehydrogenase E2 component (dihydrolipoamide succinyltransferase)
VAIEQIKVPVLAESVADATLLNWQKQPGEAVQEGDILVEIETDKVVLEINAFHSGTLTEIIKSEGELVQSEEIIAILDTNAIPTKSVSETTVFVPEHKATTKETTTTVTPAKTSPAVRKMAAEQKLDPASVPHQGDRITKADLLQKSPNQPDSSKIPELRDFKTQNVNASKIASPEKHIASSVSKEPATDTLSQRPRERVPMTRLRKRVAERLLQAQHEHAILTTFNEVNMKAVVDLRQQYKEVFEKKHGVKLGFMSFFTKAAVVALQKFPIINASTDGDDIIYHGYYDIGIAVSSPRGLVVPILRDVDAMSFSDIEKAIGDFGKRARDVQLNIDELTGGTFTITNGGVFGSMLSTPILNPPQSAILGMHNIVERPVAENGQVVIRPVMYIALSYDHRLIDGRDAVQFLVTIKNVIEDPARLLLEI